MEEAQKNVLEAVMVFLENADKSEIDQYLQPIKRKKHIMATRAKLEMQHGQAQGFVWA